MCVKAGWPFDARPAGRRGGCLTEAADGREGGMIWRKAAINSEPAPQQHSLWLGRVRRGQGRFPDGLSHWPGTDTPPGLDCLGVLHVLLPASSGRSAYGRIALFLAAPHCQCLCAHSLAERNGREQLAVRTLRLGRHTWLPMAADRLQTASRLRPASLTRHPCRPSKRQPGS